MASEQLAVATRKVFPDRASWLEARRQGIGGSDAPAVLGVSRWKGPLAVYTEKLGIAEPEEESAAMRWGRRLEAAIADAYQEETGRRVTDLGPFTLTVHGAIPVLIATLDRLVECPERGPGVLQIKTTGWPGAEDWQEEPPLEAQVQLQHEMEIAGVPWGSLAVLIAGREFRWTDLERNEPFARLMVDKELAFWKRVEEQEPPPPDALEATREALRRLYPKDTGGTVVLPPEAVEWDRLRMEAKAQVKTWEAREAEAENFLKSAIGEATFGLLPGQEIRYSWKHGTRKGYTVEETEGRTLRRLIK